MLKRGFTLIELMVSVTIFAIVMVMALGALLSISAADRKAESLKSVMNNLNFALDSMTRTIRTGLYYQCTSASSAVSLDSNGYPVPTNCSSGNTALAFRSVDNNNVVYRFNITCAPKNTGCVERSTDGGANFLPLTAPEVVVDDLKFYVVGACASPGSGSCSGSDTNDYVQPKVTITLNGHVQVTGTQTTAFPYTIQATVTQRVYDQ